MLFLSWILTQGKVFASWGPIGIVRYARMHTAGVGRVHVFGQGLTVGTTSAEAQRWYLANAKPLVVALIGIPGEPIGEWIVAARKELKVRFLIAPDALQFVSGVDPALYQVCEPLGDAEPSFFRLKDWLAQNLAKSDVLMLDLAYPLVPAAQIARLQHAAYTYDRGQREIGFVSPALTSGERRVIGYEWDRADRTWVSRSAVHDLGQGDIPRYVLAANSHGLYVTQRALDQVRFGSVDAAGLTFEQQVRRMIALGWQQNVRTLAFPPVELAARGLRVPEADDFDRAWLTNRAVIDADGHRRIIFVLAGTSISGGIRTVFEQADEFESKGFSVEIWALQGHPDWFDLRVPVKTFQTFFDMIPALRNEQAVKVATWWETAEVVWLSTAHTGVAVNYVQEFETWFYPDDEVARAAVASSYRLEMAHLTIASFQQEELAGVGVSSTYIPSCFDERKFLPLPGVQRRDDTLMALGRSFFQKNFGMTVAAWRSLGDSRPRLSLFGFEPDILTERDVHYEVRPTDDRVNELYNEATMFVQTSLHEGFSLPLIEAMAAGCPVITTDSHGNRDFCRDGENCIIVEQHDVDGLAAAIRFLQEQPDERKRLSHAGLATAADYSQGVIFHRLEQFYANLN